MKTTTVLVLSFVLGTAAGLAAAVEVPIPKVMSDAPREDGKWKMEVVQIPGADRAATAAAGSGMTVCTSAAKAMSRDNASAQKNNCQFKLLEDGATRAVMETQCSDSGKAVRTTITKLGPRSYEMNVQQMAKPNDKPTIVRMSYAGTCSASDSVIGLDKDSEQCKQMRAHMGEIDKAKASCASAGANRATCEQMIERQRTMFASMCGGK